MTDKEANDLRTEETNCKNNALRALLDNSVVVSSTRDDVTLCVTAAAYEAAYAALNGESQKANTP